MGSGPYSGHMREERSGQADMARASRVLIPGGWYHVRRRGIRRADLSTRGGGAGGVEVPARALGQSVRRAVCQTAEILCVTHIYLTPLPLLRCMGLQGRAGPASVCGAIRRHHAARGELFGREDRHRWYECHVSAEQGRAWSGSSGRPVSGRSPTSSGREEEDGVCVGVAGPDKARACRSGRGSVRVGQVQRHSRHGTSDRPEDRTTRTLAPR